MISPLMYAMGFAVLMAGLLVEVAVFRAVEDDSPSVYRLCSLRDKLVRLVVEGTVKRDDPHFEAIYRNVNILLSACRRLGAPDGWKVARADGRYLSHHSDDPVRLLPLPPGALPPPLEPVVVELRAALEELVGHHFGLSLVVSAQEREQIRIRRARAKTLLKMMTCPA